MNMYCLMDFSVRVHSDISLVCVDHSFLVAIVRRAQDIVTGYWSTYGFVGIAFVGGLTTILYRYLTLQSGKKLKTE